MKLLQITFFLGLCYCSSLKAQLTSSNKTFTKADTLRGSLNANRTWWDVQQYNIQVTPDFASKTIKGQTTILCEVVSTPKQNTLQIDLQQPLIVDSILVNNTNTSFERNDNIILITPPLRVKKKNTFTITIHYHGAPKVAKNAPWDGGWIFKKDAQNNPWMSVACQGLGASVWYPCKDHQSDEPDKGAVLSITVPDSLQAIANGRLQKVEKNNQQATYTWKVTQPINSYNIVPYIGKYTSFSDTLQGEKGTLDITYWVLPYQLEKAKKQFAVVKPMLRAFEYWMGAYPFYEDGYQLIEAPHLGMEHQSGIAYGNQYRNGYLGRDLSGTGWGNKWDYIVVHESGHEWYGNNITTKDIADMWVHEAFTTYSETLFVEWMYGIQAGNEYNKGQRRSIENDRAIIGPYGVNEEGSGDMYFKGANMLHTIRHSLNDDILFRNMLRAMYQRFYHSTVTTAQIEQFISNYTKTDFSSVFDQYLRTTQIPTLTLTVNEATQQCSYTFTASVPHFKIRLPITTNNTMLLLEASTKEQVIHLPQGVTKQQLKQALELQYLLKVE
jgi:aminopeptidase N